MYVVCGCTEASLVPFTCLFGYARASHLYNAAAGGCGIKAAAVTSLDVQGLAGGQINCRDVNRERVHSK
jgi:hypothetical protein